jgi:hypothetical protein
MRKAAYSLNGQRPHTLRLYLTDLAGRHPGILTGFSCRDFFSSGGMKNRSLVSNLTANSQKPWSPNWSHITTADMTELSQQQIGVRSRRIFKIAAILQ